MVSKYSKKEKFVMHELRRIHCKWPARKPAIVNNRIARGKYKCQKCGDIVGYKDFDIDHIKPVISVNRGFVDWNEYIERLFAETDGYQLLCKPCHKKKTFEEENPNR